MLRRFAVLALALTAFTTTAALAEQAEHKPFGLGFHRLEAPIGGRFWLSGSKVALDLGLGFSSEKFAGLGTDPDTGDPVDVTFNGFAIDVGVPLRVASWEQVHVLLRPGVMYTTEDDVDFYVFNDEKVKKNELSVTGEIELELFVAKNASISASHGVQFVRSKIDLEDYDADTLFGTFGSNFTNLGFHVYLW